MTSFLQFLVAGVSQGAIYALVAIGFSVIYRATHIVNFAQGEFVMIGGLGTAGAISFGLPPVVAALFALATGLLAAFALDRILVRLSRHAPIILLIIVTIGASVALRGAAQVVWGANFYTIPTFVSTEPIHIAGVTIVPQILLILAVLVAAVIMLDLFFRRARFGQAMLAAAINPVAASLVGIELRRVYVATFLIAGALGALAGLLVTPIATIQFESGLMFGLKGFSAAILGGLGHIVGAVVGGLTLGIAEAMAAGYISSTYKDVIAFAIIIGVLLIRSAGVFSGQTTGRV